MKKIIVMSLACIVASIEWASSILPGDLRYNHAAFLVSHNAYAALEHGYLVPQQVWSIAKQLENGVRALMLDIYIDEGLLGSKNEYIGLCHGSCASSRYVLTAPGIGVMPLKKALKDVKKFLTRNPSEIVTIFFEDYVKDNLKVDRDIEAAGVEDLVLKPADWDPLSNKGWPTIEWMREHNKRLVIFTDKRQTASALGGALKAGEAQTNDNSYVYYIWSNVMESDFSTLQKEKIAHEREQSAKNATSTVNPWGLRYLYLMNYYPEFYLPLKIDEFTCDELKNRFNYDRMNSLGLQEVLAYILEKNNGRYPNFIALDFVHCGNPFEIVRQINEKSAHASKQERNRMFAPVA